MLGSAGSLPSQPPTGPCRYGWGSWKGSARLSVESPTQRAAQAVEGVWERQRGLATPEETEGDKHCVCKHNDNPEPHSGRTGFKPWLYPQEDCELWQSRALAAGGLRAQVTRLASWGIWEVKWAGVC